MKSKSPRTRLDVALVERGLAESQQKAQAMILAGEVRVNDIAVQKAGTPVANDARIEVKSRQLKYASRGGVKLEGALEDFSINPADLICLDVGSSTGGFTDCLLQFGAARVYAVDVNLSQLAWKLQQDPRVTAIERNARELRATDIPEQVDLVVADVSFISVCKILAAASACAKPHADFLILIKPQFELRREDVGRGGIVEDVRLHEKAIASVRKCAEAAGLTCMKVCPSWLTGAEGNQEYFLHARKGLLK
ncbi:MAG TPA: TlyA family RNA methyltransferase [Candidatus Acidoferrum sp.]|nr:TlyA family RNA methyltransferase [Candidatus Acidoferrum sp.]